MAGWTLPASNAWFGFVLLLFVLLSGCSKEGEGEARLAKYQQTLADTLGQPLPERSAPPNIGPFPDRSERLLEVAETRESMLNVYALRECQITSLIAARNNQLGRVAPPSQRWIYELELWRRLHACWNSDIPDMLSDTDRERLERLTRTKTEQLPKVSWNSLFDSEEWVSNFSRASSPLSPDDTRSIEAQFEALAWLHQATLNQFNPDWSHDSATLESHLKALRDRPLTAEVLRALLLAQQRLDEATALLASVIESENGCRALSAAPDELKRRMTDGAAFDWLNRLETLATQWLRAIHDLFESHVPPPEAVAVYRQRWLSLEDPRAPLPALRQSVEKHYQHWQELNAHCA
ncbi:DUF3080 family protein [Billgrantia sp. LNSP4103-1]|uniref:DUF3080 family protein n=1 Tax=Billgrantia sp. LNSP4103-1 TaxID=3410266 RepID=UPI00403EFE22